MKGRPSGSRKRLGYSLDHEATRLGVTRQSIIKVWLAERLEPGRHAERSQADQSGHDGAVSTQTDLGWAGCTAVERDPQRVSGAWVFRGTRVPVAALFENLEDGLSLTEFVELFPGVTQEQARSVLEHAARSTATSWPRPTNWAGPPSPTGT